MSGCAHVSLMVIFTIREAGDTPGTPRRTSPNGDFHQWEEVRDDDERVRAFILNGDFHH